MQKRLQFSILTILILNVHSFSQSLTIDETITYLNKLSIENPYSVSGFNLGLLAMSYNEQDTNCYKGHYVFDITKEGIVTVKAISSVAICKTQKIKETQKIITVEFYIEEIQSELTTISLNNENFTDNYFTLYSKNGDYFNLYESNPEKKLIGQPNFLYLITTNRYNAIRFHNALAYLFSSAKELGYHRNDKNDPFVIRSTDNNTSTHNSQKSEYKIQLKEINSVFNLNVNIAGLMFNFVLDSGAGESNISSDTENKLVNKGVLKQNDYLSNGLYMLADGSITECKRVKIPKIIVGGKVIYNVMASVSPIGSPNLLGQSFLSKTNSWTIDNSKKCLIIH